MKLLIFLLFFGILIFHVESQICGIGSATQKYGYLFDNEEREDRFKFKATNRIIGGVTIPSGTFPWAVYLNILSFGGGCTGTIIGDRWILTAKHCIDKYGIRVFYGSSDYQQSMSQDSSDFFSTPIPFEISGEDIALIRLPNPITFNENVSSICLSRSLKPKLNDVVIVAGYGLVFKSLSSNVPAGQELNETNFVTKLPTEISAAPVHILNNDNCECHCTDPEEVASDIQEDTEICAGGINQGTMEGDSGGPQMFLDKLSLQWFQTGVTSRGSTISTGDISTVSDRGIYTKVGHFCDWIESTTNNEVTCYD